jgi:hypothetical protein
VISWFQAFAFECGLYRYSAAACDSRSGFAVLVLMYDVGVAPDCRAYTTLISCLAKSGELDKAGLYKL